MARARRCDALILGTAVLAAVLLPACVVNEPSAPPRGVSVSGPPPEPIREEARPPAPTAQSVWVNGYWHWTGVQYTWIPGHWEQAPPGATWSAPQYTRKDGAYFYEPGTWNRGQTAPRNANAIR
jgi:hypothetical protein